MVRDIFFGVVVERGCCGMVWMCVFNFWFDSGINVDGGSVVFGVSKVIVLVDLVLKCFSMD